MLHDPLKYHDPEVLQPERFLTSNGLYKEDTDISTASGFGCRQVPARERRARHLKRAD